MQAIVRAGIVIAVITGAKQGFTQTVTVQQPVVQQFGVNTAVSVPDHGSILLGSVSSAQSFGRSRGFARPSSNVSGAPNHGGARVRVQIHDLEAMDKAVLAAAARQSDGQHTTNLSGMAATAHRSLLKRHARQIEAPPAHAAELSTVRRFGRETLP